MMSGIPCRALSARDEAMLTASLIGFILGRTTILMVSEKKEEFAIPMQKASLQDTNQKYKCLESHTMGI